MNLLRLRALAHVGGMVKNICFANARAYFRLGLDAAYAG